MILDHEDKASQQGLSDVFEGSPLLRPLPGLEKHLGRYVALLFTLGAVSEYDMPAEWVHQDRMLKWEEKNLSLQKKLMAEHRATSGKDENERKLEREKRPSTHPAKELPPKEAQPPKEPKMAKREPRAKKAVKEEEGYGTELYNWNLPTKRKADLKLIVPDSLKAVMVDDWEAVTRNGQASIANLIIFS